MLEGESCANATAARATMLSVQIEKTSEGFALMEEELENVSKWKSVLD
jgi:hypothetical protein